MSDKLGLKQRAVLLILMVEGGEVSNPDLKATYGVALDGRARRQLNELKLVASRKVGRAYNHELTDGGWRWCAEELSAEPPIASSSAVPALYAILRWLGRYLDRTNLTLADMSGAAGDPAPREAIPGTIDVEKSIRDAYRSLATQPREWVSLTDLRPLLDGAPAADVDDALRRMNRTPGVNVIPESNQKALTHDDRRAAVRIGGEDKHLLSIEDA